MKGQAAIIRITRITRITQITRLAKAMQDSIKIRTATRTDTTTVPTLTATTTVPMTPSISSAAVINSRTIRTVKQPSMLTNPTKIITTTI